MKHTEVISTLYRMNLVTLGLLFIFAVASVYLVSEVTSREPRKVTCGSVRDALEARGELPSHPGLDRDRDGIPCETLSGI